MQSTALDVKYCRFLSYGKMGLSVKYDSYRAQNDEGIMIKKNRYGKGDFILIMYSIFKF